MSKCLLEHFVGFIAAILNEIKEGEYRSIEKNRGMIPPISYGPKHCLEFLPDKEIKQVDLREKSSLKRR